MLELLYIGRFDYLAQPNAADAHRLPDYYDVAVARSEADQAALKKQDECAKEPLAR